MFEQLEILRRIAEKGKSLAEKEEYGRYGGYIPQQKQEFLDLFVHLLDEIERTKKIL
jgi:hypothetical protein